jgi:hypothetical protein
MQPCTADEGAEDRRRFRGGVVNLGPISGTIEMSPERSSAQGRQLGESDCAKGKHGRRGLERRD